MPDPRPLLTNYILPDARIVVQALGMGLHVAAHGTKKTLQTECCAILNDTPCFSAYGGLKPENMVRHLNTMIAEHRVQQKKDPHISGKRTGGSEDLWQSLCDMVCDQDEAAATKGEGDAAAVEEELRKNVRAEKVCVCSAQ